MVLAAVSSCARLVGLTGDYREGSEASAGAGGSDGAAAGDGGAGAETGGAGGQGGTSGGRGGDGPGASGGESGGGADAGSAGTSSHGGSDAGDGGTSSGRGGASGGGGTGNVGGGGTGNVGGGGTGNVGGGGTGNVGGGGTGNVGGSGAAGGSGAGPTQPSCQALSRTCGLSADRDCCANERVPAGTFYRSSDSANGDLRYPATLSAFDLDTYEVTVGRFRRFVDDFGAGYHPPAGSGKNPNNAADPGWDAAWNELLPADRDELVGSEAGVKCEDTGWPLGFWTWTDAPGANENRPINCVDWYVAFAFCIWDGGRLPTEAEWNYAGAGGDEQRFFPWSEPFDLQTIGETYASYFVDATRQCGGDGMNGCAPSDIVLVGTKKDGYGRFGHADLGGNVWEWTLDLFSSYDPDCNDCANLTNGQQRVGRGGGYISNEGLLQNKQRVAFDPTYRSSAFGVRCARPAGMR
jgi:formylglycine-generating enzyme required for sulfatase activity